MESVPPAQATEAALTGLPVHRLWNLKWTNYLGAEPTEIGRFLVLVDVKGRVVFVDANSGKPKVELKGKGAIKAPPGWDADRLYVTSGQPHRRLTTFSFRNGKRLWQRDFRHPPLAPIRQGEELWVAVLDTIYALDPDLGSTTRVISSRKDAWISAVARGDDVAYLGRTGWLMLLDAQGDMVWEYDVNAPCEDAPAVFGLDIYVATSDGRALCIDRDGSLVWDVDLDSMALYTPVATSEAVYVAGVDGRVHALDPASGGTLWQATLSAPASGRPAAHGEWLAAACMDGRLWLLDTGDGGVKDSLAFDAIIQYGPAWALGRLFIVTADKHVHALGTVP